MNANNIPAGYRLVSGYAYGQNYVSLIQLAKPSDKIILNAYEQGDPTMFAFLAAIAAAPLQAEAPAPQAVVGEASDVPSGFWLAPMEPDAAMIRAGFYFETHERVLEFWRALRDHWLSRTRGDR